jgi:2-polyprenyl-3-methyl-5-hydroxy-6-metoxy-1,4-benzoquinol methylase
LPVVAGEIVLDVDGHVIGTGELVARVDRFIAKIEEAAPQSGSPESDPLTPTTTSSATGKGLGAPILPMQALHGQLLQSPELGQPTTAKGRASKFTKQLIRRFTGWYVEPRFVVQQNYDGHNIHFANGVVAELARVDGELNELRRQNLQLKLQVVSAVERLNRYRRDADSSADNYRQGVDSVVDEIVQEMRNYTREIERVGASGFSGVHIDYSAFEDRCRGSSDDLRKSQEKYLSCFPHPNGSGRIIDIGCGRGEMLEVLIEAGYDVVGVDLNSDMIETCRSKGLPVVQDDGIHFLEQVEDDSLRGIFCAQVVEHMLSSEVERLMQLAQRKLLTSGVLIVETINPRSLFALGNHFFADTSHVKPVHPETLRFICEQVGFSSVQVDERSAHPVMGLVDEMPDDPIGSAVGALLRNVFGFQDYAVVATK